MSPATRKELLELRFCGRGEFRRWLEANFASRESVWLVFEKGAPRAFKHREALEEALCFGWIDSLINRIDERSYRVMFSRRRPGSRWSERNKKIASALAASGKMAEPGRQEMETARRDGRWEQQRPQPEAGDLEKLSVALREFPGAAEKFSALSSSGQRQFLLYYIDAKREETRLARVKKIAEMILAGRGFM